jgi:hypothetical protein
MKNIMLDLETMGTSNDAAIIAIGACAFDQNDGIGERYYCKISLDSSVKSGGVMDADTVMWWLSQSDAAREELQRNRINHADALYGFAHWVYDHFDPQTVNVWGNGASFDNVILRSAYRRAALAPPWNHYRDRCYRTIKSQWPNIKINRRDGTHHNALDDAISQSWHMIAIKKAEADASAPDPIVESVRQKLKARAALGLEKYKTDLTRDDLSRVQWLEHFQSELLDGANYAEKLIQEVA